MNILNFFFGLQFYSAVYWPPGTSILSGSAADLSLRTSDYISIRVPTPGSNHKIIA